MKIVSLQIIRINDPNPIYAAYVMIEELPMTISVAYYAFYPCHAHVHV